jgi:putative oxidoreductase
VIRHPTSRKELGLTTLVHTFDRLRSRSVDLDLGRYVTVAGRALFSAIFLFAALGHFSSATIAYARGAGVPLAGLAVPASGVLAFVGGLSILLGYHARIGAWMIVLFLVPVTLMMHAFWSVSDPMMARMQQVMFMKNVAMLGGALLITQLGSGPLSLDSYLAKRRRTG